MYILHTTTAVLIAFLAVLAYNIVQNRLAKGRSRRKDLETPGSPTIPTTGDVKPPLDRKDGVQPLSSPKEVEPVNEELLAHKQLYYKLHNLEHHPDILPECRELLLSLLSSSLNDASKEPESGIISVEKFSRDGLDHFLKAKDVDVTNRWEEYLARRKAGGSREMFSDKDEAKWWLKQAAPVKYVDGAWLGHINKISTPFKYRNITKNAWQVMSEELGDGDLAKNHVHVYRDLMNDIEAGLPPADTEDFIHPRHELNEARCWKAAMAQLLISLFPHDFLPEALGFNMAYESLPLHLLKTVKELRELRLNPYYFELHISIDNADSGHAAMAMAAVANYVDMVAEEEGEEAAHVAWSPSLKTPAEEPFPCTDTEAAIVDIFAAKSFVAHKIHCNSRLRIGRRSLVDWLEPEAFKDPQWQKEFLHDLSNCRPWVVKGSSEKSRLVKELSWEGKMFGSFTQTEVEVVKAWIDELGANMEGPKVDGAPYMMFTGRSPLKSIEEEDQLDILLEYPVLLATLPACPIADLATNMEVSTSAFYLAPITKSNITNVLPLWFTSVALLESLPSVPVRAADTFGSALIRVLRAQTGFDLEGAGVAGMDEVRRTDDGHAMGIIELGLAMCRHAGLRAPTNVREAVDMGSAHSRDFSEWMVHMSTRWLEHRDLLVGISWTFMDVHVWVAEHGEEVMNDATRQTLRDITVRERAGLRVCRAEIEKDAQRRKDLYRGVAIAKRGVEACFNL
jgi:hypothetical protein